MVTRPISTESGTTMVRFPNAGGKRNDHRIWDPVLPRRRFVQGSRSGGRVCGGACGRRNRVHGFCLTRQVGTFRPQPVSGEVGQSDGIEAPAKEGQLVGTIAGSTSHLPESLERRPPHAGGSRQVEPSGIQRIHWLPRAAKSHSPQVSSRAPPESSPPRSPGLYFRHTGCRGAAHLDTVGGASGPKRRRTPWTGRGSPGSGIRRVRSGSSGPSCDGAARRPRRWRSPSTR